MIIEEEEQFDLLPYKWTQDQDYINIRFPLMEGETFENEDAVQITNNEEHGHLFALSDGDAGRTVVDIDLVQKINVEESSFKVEDDQLVFKLKKIADSKWEAVFFAKLTYNVVDEQLQFNPHAPPLDDEVFTEWFGSVIEPDLRAVHEKFEKLVAEHEDKVLGSFEQEVELTAVESENLSQEELGKAYYDEAMKALDDEAASITRVLDLFHKAASLGHGQAKERYIVSQIKTLEALEQETTQRIFTSQFEEPEQIVQEFKQKEAEIMKTIIDYSKSAAHLNLLPTSITRCAREYQQDQDFATAFVYYGKAALLGSAAAIQNIAILYFVGSEGFPKNVEKASAWWKLGLNRGSASCAYNLGIVHSEKDDLDIAYEYFELARSIDSSLVLPESFQNKLNKQSQSTQPEHTPVTTTTTTVTEEDEEEIEEFTTASAAAAQQPATSSALTFDFSKLYGSSQPSKPSPFLPDFDEDIEDEELEQKEDKPGLRWVVSEWLLTGGILGGIGYFLWSRVRVNVD